MNLELDNATQSQQEEISLTVNANEYNIIMTGLRELPHRISDSVIKKIFAQMQIQLATNK